MTEQAEPEFRAEETEETEAIETTAGWLMVVSAIMDGQTEPRAGVARLRALQAEHPADADWLEAQIETLRWTFALDVEDLVSEPGCDYWEKFLGVAEALVEERLRPRQAVRLLERVKTEHPEHAARVQQVIDDVVQSPLWQIVEEG